MDREGANLEALQVAQAARNCGGIVIAQVEYLAKAGTLHAKSIQVPGVLVDYVVVSKNPQEWHMQSEDTYYQPAFSGDVVMPLAALPKLPFNERLFILRRASMEFTEKSVVNLGIGIPDSLGSVAAYEGVTRSSIESAGACCCRRLPRSAFSMLPTTPSGKRSMMSSATTP